MNIYILYIGEGDAVRPKSASQPPDVREKLPGGGSGVLAAGLRRAGPAKAGRVPQGGLRYILSGKRPGY